MFYSNITELSNILNSRTLTIACSVQLCGGGIVGTVACVYQHRALVDGEAMYEKGLSCRNGSNCTAFVPATCNTSQNLCVKENDSTTTSTVISDLPTTSTASSPITTVHATTTEAATENLHPNPQINQICPVNSGMNDRLRVKAVDMHNYRRSQLAKGEVAKFNGNKLPTATNMRKLVYDCGLEAASFTHAISCSNLNSNRSLRQGVEENVQWVSGNGVTFRVDALGEAIKTWWKQIRLQTQAIGMAVTFKRHHVDLPISYFTMMAWSTTEKLGCGVAKCDNGFFVVCQYQPGGNIVDATVYTPGAPCTKCPADTYCVYPLCTTV